MQLRLYIQGTFFYGLLKKKKIDTVDIEFRMLFFRKIMEYARIYHKINKVNLTQTEVVIMDLISTINLPVKPNVDEVIKKKKNITLTAKKKIANHINLIYRYELLNSLIY